MPKRSNEFDAFMAEVAAEAAATGTTLDLEAYTAHFQLAREVIALRKRHGWSQQQLAAKSGVQQSEISRIERAQGNPTFRTLQALAQTASKRVAFVSARTVKLPTKKSGARTR